RVPGAQCLQSRLYRAREPRHRLHRREGRAEDAGVIGGVTTAFGRPQRALISFLACFRSVWGKAEVDRQGKPANSVAIGPGADIKLDPERFRPAPKVLHASMLKNCAVKCSHLAPLATKALSGSVKTGPLELPGALPRERAIARVRAAERGLACRCTDCSRHLRRFLPANPNAGCSRAPTADSSRRGHSDCATTPSGALSVCFLNPSRTRSI